MALSVALAVIEAYWGIMLVQCCVRWSLVFMQCCKVLVSAAGCRAVLLWVGWMAVVLWDGWDKYRASSNSLTSLLLRRALFDFLTEDIAPDAEHEMDERPAL